MVSKETAYNKISQLVTRFSEQIGSYKNSDYNETLTRRDFIDPFFKALGWDMDNEEGNAEAYREVIHEDKIKIGSATKAPDYSFRLAGGKRLFFVEAKKPSVHVKEEIPPAYQIRRYGWSAKLPISIVTDFEEFAIYDCTKKPKATDKASTARIKYLTYKEYLEEFDFLWDTFSKERVLKGSFDKFVLSDTGKKGTATVDKEFLESLNDWRKLLAESISINNLKLNEDQLNFAVQQTLDRIIFLRICEDRGVEPYEKLKYCLNSPLERGTPKAGGVYSNLFQYFEEADKKYNSGLFDLAKDNVSRNLNIDNKVLKKIIEELYYPVSPYEFSVLSVEILGSAYEQFLGKVIRLTPSHKAKIEEKPEVRKAGGVYYTPQYIVDYIVKNTVGKLIEGKTPKEVEKIKIVDPACGSGSFLIGAYQYLLDWHLSYYMGSSVTHPGASRHPSPEGNKSKALTPDGRLTTAEKKRILINNIYGVDIDTQATEVTKLSLLLKCMEGETLASVQQTMSFMHERLLPTLENNIKSGNSLIDMDFYDGELEFSGTERKIKPFNWQAAFPEVFRLPLNKGESAQREGVGGFDCVIGNPPYVNFVALSSEEREYFKIKYKTYKNKSDLYSFFIERAFSLIKKENYRFSFIVPHTWLATDSFELLRHKLLNERAIEKIVEMGFKVFERVIVSTVILVCSPKNKKTEVLNKDFTIRFQIENDIWRNNNSLIDLEWSIGKQSIDERIKNNSQNLGNIIEFSRGIKTSNDSRFLDKKARNKDYKKIFRGRNIKAYQLNWEGEYIWYRPDLMKEKVGSLSHSKEFFEVPEKLITQRVNSSMQLLVAYDDKQNYFLDTTNVSRYTSWNKNYSLKYICGILNSKLINYWYCNKYKMPTIGLYELNSIPIHQIDFTNPAEKKKHDEIVKHVETMLELNKELQKAKLASEQEQIKQRITYTDKKIDSLVYELYGLTEEEIKVIEN